MLLELLEHSDCLRLHVWKECSRRVYFMKLRQGYINDYKKAEKKKEKWEKKKERQKERKKEKICKLGVFGKHQISILLSADLILIV